MLETFSLVLYWENCKWWVNLEKNNSIFLANFEKIFGEYWEILWLCFKKTLGKCREISTENVDWNLKKILIKCWINFKKIWVTCWKHFEKISNNFWVNFE